MFTEVEQKFIEYVSIDADDVNIKNSLIDILSWAEDFIFSVYNIAINERTITESIDGNGLNKIYTNKGDISSITSLILDDIAVDTSVLKFSKNMVYYKDNTFTSGTFNVELTYKVGYSAAADIPEGLINALFVIGRKMYTDETKNFDAYTSISSDTKQSVKLIDSIPTLAESLLQAYRVYKL